MPMTYAAHSYTLAALGAALILAGAAFAFFGRARASRILIGLVLADLGHVAVGFGFGGASGQSGAVMTLVFNGAARALALLCLLDLQAYAALNGGGALRGIGKARPLTALIFSFAVFAGLGITPFFAPDIKPLLIYAGLTAGETSLTLLLALGNALMALLSALAVQELWAGDAYADGHRHSPEWTSNPLRMFILFLPAVFLACLGLFRHNFLAFTSSFLSVEASDLPSLTSDCHYSVWVMYAGAFGLLVLGRLSRVLRNLAAALLPAAALFLLLTDASTLPLSRFFGVITTGIGFLIALYSWGYIHGKQENAYYACLLLMFASLTGVATAANLGGFFEFWELMTLSSYILVAWEDTENAHAAARKYFIMCSMAADLMLPGLLIFPASGGGLDFGAIVLSSFSLPPGAALLAAVLITIGCGVKAGLFPGHSWLPDAHPAAPSSISAPLSGVLTKAGLFGLAQLFLLVLGLGNYAGQDMQWMGVPVAGWLLTILGLLTMFYGEIMALRQSDLKRLLAYSTMGQIGEISMALGLCGWLAASGALMHILNHAVMKDLLFLCSGALILRAGSRNLADLRGLGKAMPFTSACMVTGLIAILGLPPLAGFMSKFMMLYALATVNPLLSALMLLASLAGCVYYTRIIRTLIFEPYSGPPVEEAPWSMRIPLGILALLCLVLGLFPQLSLDNLVLPALAGLGGLGHKLAVQALPSLQAVWPSYSILLLAGAFVPALLRKNPARAGQSAAFLLALSAVLVCMERGSLDTLSFIFALIITVVGCANMIYSVGYMTHSHTQWRFYSFFLCMSAGLTGVAASADLFSFFLFWEIMSSWSLYFVIVHEENEAALREGFKYFFFNVLGAAFLFLGVVLLIHWAGGAEFSKVRAALSSLDGWRLSLAFFLMACGFVMKAAQLPFRIDIQMHPATAPTPVSGYISSVLLKSAVFGLAKLFLALGGGALAAGLGAISVEQIMRIVVWVGGITIVMAAAFAVFQSDVKLVLIYSTVSQLGYMVTGVGLGSSLGVAGGLLHLVNHVFFKDLLFLVAGALIVSTHRQSLNEMGGLGRKMPFTLAFFAIGAACVIGIPPSSGFTSKWIIYHALMEQGFVFVAILSLLGSVLTLAYFAKMLHSAFLGQPGTGLEDAHEAPKVMLWPMAFLSLGCVLTSLFPGLILAPLNDVLLELGLVELDVAPWGLNSGSGAWNATLTALLMALALVSSGLLLRRLSRKQRVTAIHVCGVALEGINPRAQTGDIYSAPASLLRRRRGTHSTSEV